MNKHTNKVQNIMQTFLKLPNLDRVFQIGFDSLAIFVSLSGAMFLRYETNFFFYQIEYYLSYLIILLPTIYLFARLGLYKIFIRYISTEIAALIALGSSLSSIFIILTKVSIAPFIPWSIPIIYTILLFSVLTGLRFTLREMYLTDIKKHGKNVAIYGAGVGGAELLKSLVSSPDYYPKMIIDDNPNLQGHRIFGLKIMSFKEASENFSSMKIEMMLLAMPGTNFAERNKIIDKMSDYALEVKTIPAINELIKGSAQITEFRNVMIEDLLSRKPVDPLSELISESINGKSVLVTGAGGSIGSELSRQIIHLSPKKLLLLDISETGIYNIITELDALAKRLKIKLVPFVGGVNDQPFVSSVLAQHKIDTIYHAAAYKHVPLMEQNIIQAIKNNTIGTLIIAEEAGRAKVNNFTLVSTDKSVNPTNAMGASKRLAERICQTMNTKHPMTNFSIVRFGNVLDSSGSVVPLFRKQIAAGGPITLTNPDIIRYFMTITEAVELVIQTSSLAKGGEIFVLDMGVPVKIKDLAFKMVELSGLRPYLEEDTSVKEGDIAIHITGLRPGEKMFEELSHSNNLISSTHPRIMIAHEKAMTPKSMTLLLDHLEELIVSKNETGILRFMAKYANYKKNNI